MSKGKDKMPFAREATGLVREIGWFTALAMVMSAVIGAGINTFAVQAYGYTSTNSVSPLAMVLLVAIPFGCSAICLGIMSSAMPRSGGPYVIMSRSVHPAVGFLASWGSWVSIALSVGLLAQWDVYFWGMSFEVAGATTGIAGITALGLALEDIWNSIIVAIVIVVLITIIIALGANIWGRVVQILFIIPLIGSVITVGILLAHTGGDLQPFWDTAFGAGTYNTINASALPFTPDLVASFAALPAIIFAFSAFYASSYVGGEVKNPKRNMVTSLVVGTGFIILLFLLYTGGLARAVGEPFLYAYNVSAVNPVGAPAMLPLFASVYVFSVPILATFIAVTGALWLLNDLPPFYLIATRSTFAWSFDRQFPEKFSEVSDRFHSPVWSVVLCLFLAIPGVILSGLTPLGSLFFITFIDCFTYLFICVGALFFIKRFKSAYAKGSKLGGPVVLKLFGVIGTIFWIFMLGAMLYFLLIVNIDVIYIPDASFWETVAIGVTFLIGALIFAYYRWRNKKLGIDTSKIYGEIPPE